MKSEERIKNYLKKENEIIENLRLIRGQLCAVGGETIVDETIEFIDIVANLIIDGIDMYAVAMIERFSDLAKEGKHIGLSDIIDIESEYKAKVVTYDAD